MTITATEIGLSWNAPAEGGAVEAYDVLIRVAGAQAFSIHGSTTGTAYVADGLVPSTEYEIVVQARNDAGPGGLSGLVTVATLGAVPSAVTGLGASAGSPAHSAVVLDWVAPVPDATHGPASFYKVFFRIHTGADDPWTLVDDAVVALTRSVTGLAHATAYDFLVVPWNDDGGAVANATVLNFATDIAPPAVPGSIAVAPVNDGTATKLAVTWATPGTDADHDAATGFDLRHSPAGAGTWTTLTGVASGAVITGLAAGTAYDVQVRATNGSTASPGAWSGSVTASAWANTVSVANPPTGTPIASGSGPIVQVDITGAFTTAQAVWAASGTVVPASGWQDSAGAFSTFEAVWFLGGGASTAPGTAYLWVRTVDGGGVTIGRVVQGPYTFT